jgi:hypothetical protein
MERSALVVVPVVSFGWPCPADPCAWQVRSGAKTSRDPA